MQVYDVEDDADIVDLFRQVNNTKPLSPKDTPNSIIMAVVKRLGKDYNPAIVFDKTRTVYPYILAKEFQERLSNIDLDGRPHRHHSSPHSRPRQEQQVPPDRPYSAKQTTHQTETE